MEPRAGEKERASFPLGALIYCFGPGVAPEGAEKNGGEAISDDNVMVMWTVQLLNICAPLSGGISLIPSWETERKRSAAVCFHMAHHNPKVILFRFRSGRIKRAIRNTVNSKKLSLNHDLLAPARALEAGFRD